MKTIRQTLIKTVFLCSILALYTACKKDKDRSTISHADLIDYQIVVLLKSPTKTETRAVFFSKAENSVIARLVGIDSDHAQSVSMKNNTLTVREGGEQKSSFQFSLKQDNAGNITINTVSYNIPDDVNMKVEAFYMTKTTGMFPLPNSDYSGPAGLQFMANTWRYTAVNNVVGSYSPIAPGAWKGSLGGSAYMGVSIKEDNRWHMVLQIGKNRYDIFYLV